MLGKQLVTIWLIFVWFLILALMPVFARELTFRNLMTVKFIGMEKPRFIWGIVLAHLSVEYCPQLIPIVKVTILSGAGGAAISFILAQKTPVDIARMLEIAFNFKSSDGDNLDMYDPVLTIMQMIFDQADIPTFAPYATYMADESIEQKSFIQLHGLGDTYTPEFTANSVANAFGLDVVNGDIDDEVLDRVSFNGGELVEAPVTENRTLPGSKKVTNVIKSYNVPGAPSVNPHYGTFRMEEVKFMYSCFLETFLNDGIPTLLAPVDDSAAECK